MERGNGFHRYRRHASLNSQQQANPSSNKNGNDRNNINNSAGLSPSNSNQQQQLQSQLPPAPRASIVREQDQYMPIANVIRIMRRILPAHAKISDDAKETVQECVSEYISFITGEANDRCQQEQRKTITAEDILWAMGKLGFDDYVEPLTIFINRYRETESDRTSIRDPILKRSSAVAMDYGTRGMTAYAPMYPPPPPADHAAFYAGAGGFYRDPHGASSSQNLQATYDPFAQFK